MSAGRLVADDVAAELFGLLVASLVPPFIMAVAILASGIFFAMSLHDPVVAVLTVLHCVNFAFRVFVVLRYRRLATRDVLGRDAVKRWERRFALSSFIFSILFAMICVRGLILLQPNAPVLVTGLIFAYGSGLVTRYSSHPLICIPSLVLAVIPIEAALIWCIVATGGASWLAYAIPAMLIAVFSAACIETIFDICRTTLGYLVTRRDLAVHAERDARAAFEAEAERLHLVLATERGLTLTTLAESFDGQVRSTQYSVDRRPNGGRNPGPRDGAVICHHRDRGGRQRCGCDGGLGAGQHWRRDTGGRPVAIQPAPCLLRD